MLHAFVPADRRAAGGDRRATPTTASWRWSATCPTCWPTSLMTEVGAFEAAGGGRSSRWGPASRTSPASPGPTRPCGATSSSRTARRWSTRCERSPDRDRLLLRSVLERDDEDGVIAASIGRRPAIRKSCWTTRTSRPETLFRVTVRIPDEPGRALAGDDRPGQRQHQHRGPDAAPLQPRRSAATWCSSCPGEEHGRGAAACSTAWAIARWSATAAIRCRCLRRRGAGGRPAGRRCGTPATASSPAVRGLRGAVRVPGRQVHLATGPSCWGR